MDAQTKINVDKLHKAAITGDAVPLALETDDRVLARVTDGIYRQPSSAIRELIANAYDADATTVEVITDAPRYSQIIVRDNGRGMSAPVLCNMIQHIGGSAKRTLVGQQSGVTDKADAHLSPGRRRLIGKMGIGLFSVAQLTRQFTIITKPIDESYRYTAVLTLRRYTDDGLELTDNDSTFNAGNASIRVDTVDDSEPHGTTIILDNIMPRAKRVLQSREVWEQLRTSETIESSVVQRVAPCIHSGLANDSETGYQIKPEVPWKPKTPSTKRMRMLSDSLIEAVETNELYAQMYNALDYYYRMIWNLGLSLPLPYLVRPPFALPDSTQTQTFAISNRSRPSAPGARDNQVTELQTSSTVTSAEAAKITPPKAGEDFAVEIDGLRLLRPVRFDFVPSTGRALKTPLLFVGSFNPDLSAFDKSQRGGHALEFCGYFYWTPRISPREHNGILIRINGASGTLFDTTFLNYQIAERQRLKQVTAEVFVSRGLEEALNIDRESFNTAHPHYQILLNWVHNSLRQVFNKQKDLESALRTNRRAETGAVNRSAVQSTRDAELKKALGEEQDTVRPVEFTDDPVEKKRAEKEGREYFRLRKP